MNIIVSGWPSSGGSTIAILLSYSLGYRYLGAGALIKYLSNVVYGSTETRKLIEFIDQYGSVWDDLWETYREWKLNNSENLLVDGKLAGFLQKDKSKVFSIMITADARTRLKRAGLDSRSDTLAEIVDRDNEIRADWQKTFDIDIFNSVDIDKHYNLHIE